MDKPDGGFTLHGRCHRPFPCTFERVLFSPASIRFRGKDTKSRVQRQIKTQFSIRLCRDGVSKAKPKCGKPSAETNENAVFDSAVPVPKYPRRSQSAESRAQKQKAGYSRFCPYSESGFESPFRRQHRLQFTPPVGIALRTQNPITERRTRIGIRTAVIHIDRLGGD